MGRRRSPATAEKDLRVLELRRRGLSYPQIAAEMGCSLSSAYDSVQRALADTAREATQEVRLIEAQRLDDLTRTLNRVLVTRHYVVTQSGKLAVHPETGQPLIDDGPVMQAVGGLVRISERRAKLLGLDAPVKHEVRNIDAVDARLLDLADEMALGDPGTAARVPREA